MCVRKIILLLTVFVFLLVACGGAAEPTLLPPDEAEVTREDAPVATDPRAPVGDTSDVITAEFGVRFHLRIGQGAMIDDLVITFLAVSEDSRCPEGAQCFWAGRVKVGVRVEKDGQAIDEFELTEGAMTEGDVGEVEVAGIVVRLLGVQPYPVMGEQILEGEYVLELVVE